MADEENTLAGEQCGSQPCNKIVDRLGQLLRDQQAEGFKSIKELMTVHHQNLRDEIIDLKKAHKDLGDEIFPRLRIVEERVRVIEVTALTETKVKDIVAENETVKWTRRRRSLERSIAIPILVLIIGGALTAGWNMYSDYQKAKDVNATAPTTTQHK